jgi:hypothetical protein
MEKFDRVQFEEKRISDLMDKFIDKNTTQWNEFVDEEYQSYLEDFQSIQEIDVEDYLLEQSREEEYEKGENKS